MSGQMRVPGGVCALAPERPETDPLAPLRLFADIRGAANVLRVLDTPDKGRRSKLIRDPAIYKALTDMLYAADKLVAPDPAVLFWQPTREPFSAAEKRFEKLASQRL